MITKTFMTHEDDGRQIIKLYWPYYNGDGCFEAGNDHSDNCYAIDNKTIISYLEESEKYDIIIQAYSGADSYIDIPVRVLKDVAQSPVNNSAKYSLVGFGYDSARYLHSNITPGNSEGLPLYYFAWDYDDNNDIFHFCCHNISGGGNSNPCLIEGTPINMADGTSKPIELVRSGDIVLSYDPNTETQVPAVVLSAYPTGAERLYSVYNFSNGKHLTIYGLHGYYDKVSGATRDIRNINRDKRLLDIDGNIIQWAGTRERHFAGQKKVRYNIITSNNLYYANGILLGSRPYNKLQYHLDRGINLPENIKSVWQQDCNDYNAYEDLLTDGAFWSEVAEDYQELAKARNIIRVNKKRLENTDYQNAKHVEGLLTEEEWDNSMARRAFFRKEINDNESVYRTHQDNVDKVIARYRGDMTAKSIFDACCERDNAIFEIVKNHFSSK